MAILKTYPIKTTLSSNDRFILSDMQPDSNGVVHGTTKNITFSNVKSALEIISGTGTAGTIPKWSDSNTLTNSIISESASKIGIGIIAPTEKLDVVGNIKTSGYLSLSKGSNTLKISTPATITTSYELVMPAAVGTASQVLKLPSTLGTSPYQLEWGDAGGGITATAEGGTGSAISSAALYNVLIGNGSSGSGSAFEQSGDNETAIQLSVGSTARRPAANAANVGLIRYNTTLAKFEGVQEITPGSSTYAWFQLTSTQ